MSVAVNLTDFPKISLTLGILNRWKEYATDPKSNDVKLKINVNSCSL